MIYNFILNNKQYEYYLNTHIQNFILKYLLVETKNPTDLLYIKINRMSRMFLFWSCCVPSHGACSCFCMFPPASLGYLIGRSKKIQKQNKMNRLVGKGERPEEKAIFFHSRLEP